MPIQIVRNDITKIKCDAVVNADNSTLLVVAALMVLYIEQLATISKKGIMILTSKE